MSNVLSNVSKKPSVLLLLAANVVPIIGALFFGWEIFHIMLLYWFESAIIGFYTLCKMLTAGLLGKEFMIEGKGRSVQLPVRGIGAIIRTLFVSGFFIVH